MSHAMLDHADATNSAVAQQLFNALPDIYDAYIATRRGPPEDVIYALIGVLGGSPNEQRRHFAKYARSKGSNLFFVHYPAFGEDGCEYEPPEGGPIS